VRSALVWALDVVLGVLLMWVQMLYIYILFFIFLKEKTTFILHNSLVFEQLLDIVIKNSLNVWES